MKLLIVTQSVDLNDPVLGFFHRWLEEFSKYADVDVIANRVGTVSLPSNVRVFSLGKERGASRILRYFEYQKLLFQLIPKSDGVFFHMCPEYVVGAHILPFVLRKRTALWYTHKHVSTMLRIATYLVDKIFTASSESFRLQSSKLEVTGHGIDTGFFVSSMDRQDKNEILSVSRISSTKNILILLKACLLLREKGESFHCTIVGAPGEGDTVALSYYDEVKRFVEENNLQSSVSIVGEKAYASLPPIYQTARVFVNLSQTGSLDKAVLEAMASGCQIVTSNEAFFLILPAECHTHLKPEVVVEAIQRQLRNNVSQDLRDIVTTKHSLARLIGRIVSFY